MEAVRQAEQLIGKSQVKIRASIWHQVRRRAGLPGAVAGLVGNEGDVVSGVWCTGIPGSGERTGMHGSRASG